MVAVEPSENTFKTYFSDHALAMLRVSAQTALLRATSIFALTEARPRFSTLEAHSTRSSTRALSDLSLTLLIFLQKANQMRVTAKHHICSAQIARFASHMLPTCTAPQRRPFSFSFACFRQRKSDEFMLSAFSEMYRVKNHDQDYGRSVCAEH